MSPAKRDGLIGLGLLLGWMLTIAALNAGIAIMLT